MAAAILSIQTAEHASWRTQVTSNMSSSSHLHDSPSQPHGNLGSHLQRLPQPHLVSKNRIDTIVKLGHQPRHTLQLVLSERGCDARGLLGHRVCAGRGRGMDSCERNSVVKSHQSLEYDS